MTSTSRPVIRLALGALVALALTMSLAVAPAEAVQDLDAEQRFIALINADRKAAGLQSLAPADDVRSVALAWSHTMAAARKMWHNPKYHEQYCCWRRAAENVGWTTVSDMNDPGTVAAAVERLHKAFMDSEGHRKNIMHPEHDHIGLAIEMRADSCPDGVSSRNCMWVTENFREWDGTQPAGGLKSPYSSSRDRDASGETIPDVTVSDKVFSGGFDNNEATVERLGANADSAVQLSQARFGSDAATHAVVARDDSFPDSLAGAPLTADGPLLFTPSAGLSAAVTSELQRVLPKGATVYLLGGDVALSPSVDRAIRNAGLSPKRLAGPTRVETALVVADEVRRVYGDTDAVAIARAHGHGSDPNGPTGWVDSVTGGAWAASRGVPVLISPTEKLPGNVRAWLDTDGPRTTILLGGETALSRAVLDAAPRATRIAGGDRTDTAAAVSSQLWGVTAGSSNREFIVIDGWARDGWRHGLASAGLAADTSAPVLLANASSSGQPAATSSLVGACTTKSVDLLMIGSLGNDVAGTLEALDGRAC